MISNKNEYISLKDAAKISGYSADYVGQLIRSGKLPGKQVFLNVAWMTTEKAILEYLNKEKKGGAVENVSFFGKMTKYFVSPEGLRSLNVIVMSVVVTILSLFVLLLVAVLAVSIDHGIDQTSLHKVHYAP